MSTVEGTDAMDGVKEAVAVVLGEALEGSDGGAAANVRDGVTGSRVGFEVPWRPRFDVVGAVGAASAVTVCWASSVDVGSGRVLGRDGLLELWVPAKVVTMVGAPPLA